MSSRHVPRVAGLVALLALAFGTGSGLSSCAYQNEEELLDPQPVSCDSVSVTYRGTIAPLMVQHCQRCHGPGRAESGVVVTSHHSMQTLGRTGLLVGVISHQAGYPAMPQGAPRLSDCDISKVRSWVRAGMPDN